MSDRAHQQALFSDLDADTLIATRKRLEDSGLHLSDLEPGECHIYDGTVLFYKRLQLLFWAEEDRRNRPLLYVVRKEGSN